MSLPDESCADLIEPPTFPDLTPDTDRISREVDPDLDALFALVTPPESDEEEGASK